MAFDVRSCMKNDDQGTPFMVVLNNTPAKIHIERIYEFRYRDDDIQLASFSKIEEDRGGMLSYSRAQVWFDSQTFDSGRFDKSLIRLGPDQFIDLSIDYLNKFIKTYKLITNEYWLRPIIRKDIFNIQYILVDTDNNQQVCHELAMHHLVEFNGGKEFVLPDQDEDLLRKLLVSDVYDFDKEFLLNLNDNFSLGYYNITILQAVTWFEYFVYTHLKLRLSKTKLDKLKKKDCGCMVGISEVCKRGFLEYFGVDFADTDEFRSLKENALKYRNPIVHGELIELINRETCQRALDSVHDAQEYLIKNVFSKADSG